MNTYIIDRLYQYFTTRNDLDNIDKIKLKYMLTIVVNESLKVIFMLLLFGIIGKMLDFLVCLLTLTVIRSFSGGFHIKNFLGCLIFTSLFFFSCMYISNLILINKTVFIILYSFSITSMALFAPKTSKQRGAYSSYEKQKFKLKSMITTTLCFLILFFKKDNPYLISIVWVVVFQAIQLLISEGRDRYENIKKVI